MSKNSRSAIPTSLAMAALLAAGMTAAPFAFSTASGIAPNLALAGDAPEMMPGTMSRSTMARTDYSDPMATLGVTEQGPNAVTGHEENVIGRYISDYKRAMSRGELSLAADDLAAAAHRPITESMVTALNTELGVQSPLADVQIAHAAEARQRTTS